jgi:uncharacterized protein (TIGR02996 family)
MTDNFLRAIIEDPEDDGPRLVYADWLDEHGQPERAAFIRLQLERAPLEPHNHTFGPTRADPRVLTRAEAARRKRLLEREGRLWDEHGQRWLAKLPVLKGIEWGRPYRGLVEEVRVDSFRTFRTHAGRLFELVPLRGVDFQDMKADSAVRLASFPALARLRYLTFHGSELGDRGAIALAESPHVANLTSLEMSMSMVDDAGAAALARSPYLGNLRALFMYMNRTGSAGAAQLARSTTLSRLAVLVLELNHVTDWGARAFAETDQLPELLFLSLYDQFSGPLSREVRAALRRRWCKRLLPG